MVFGGATGTPYGGVIIWGTLDGMPVAAVSEAVGTDFVGSATMLDGTI